MEPVLRQSLPRQIPLSTLFVGTALAAVALGLGRWALEWGLLAAALFVTALVRTLRHMQGEQASSLTDQAWLFAQSCCLQAFVALCAIITFTCIAAPVAGFLLMATAAVGTASDLGLLLSLAGGGLTAAYVTKVVIVEALREYF